MNAAKKKAFVSVFLGLNWTELGLKSSDLSRADGSAPAEMLQSREGSLGLANARPNEEVAFEA